MSMDIEKMATSAVEESISMTEVLSPFINNGDKEPAWDGNIYIYSNKKKTVDGIKKVPVQVKGVTCNKQDEEVSFQARVTVLKDYLSDGGVLFFVVYIDDTGKKKQIYYTDLLPIKLRVLLSDLKEQEQGTKIIHLKKFPDENNEKVEVLLNFYNNMKKQTSFANAKLLSEDELIKNGVLESISFNVTAYGKKPVDIVDLFTKNDLYAYANIKNSSIPQPLEEIVSNIHFVETITKAIYVNGNKYYDSIVRMRSKEGSELVFGKSFHMFISNNAQEVKVKFELTNLINDAIQDLSFILALNQSPQIYLEQTLLFDFSDKQPFYNEEQLKDMDERLNYYKQIVRLFEALHIHENLDLSSMDEEDIRNTERLINSILFGKKVSGLRHDLPWAGTINYCGAKILLVFKKTEEPGTYFIADYFKDNSFVLFHLVDGERAFTSRFSNLTANDFLTVGNVDYDAIIESFKQYKDEPYCADDANRVLLEMITAYDKSNETRMDIIDHAYCFAEFIYNELGTDKVISQLNIYQISKRQNKLDVKQKKELMSIANETKLDDYDQECAVKYGAYLLLGNYDQAHYYFDKMSDSKQAEYINYPIYKFEKKE